MLSYNGSKIADISSPPDENESIDICIFSQSLMGSNWRKYIEEAKRVLKYNGEMIISESVERYDTIKEYIDELNLQIGGENYNKNNRWFFLRILNCESKFLDDNVKIVIKKNKLEKPDKIKKKKN